MKKQLTSPQRCVQMAGLALGFILSSHAHAGYNPTPYFVDPANWVVGDSDTTYQEWDDVRSATPDIGYSANPALSSTSSLAPVSPGFATSSGNFYSFSGDYGFAATVYNFGGSSGSGSFGSEFGTHVIIQTGSTLNEGDGVYANSLQILDSLGNSLTGGDNSSALRHSVIFEGTFASSMGDVTLREEIWEFYLPGYVDDFQVVGDMKIHSSFDTMRIDSAIATSALGITAVPEPSTYAIGFSVLTLGFVLLCRRRR